MEAARRFHILKLLVSIEAVVHASQEVCTSVTWRHERTFGDFRNRELWYFT